MEPEVEAQVNGRRLGRLGYVGAWLLLTAPQIVAAVLAQGAWTAAERDTGSATLAVVAVVVLQGLKALVAVPRFRDLGRPPDDATWALVPILNVVAFVQLLGGAPSEEARLRRIRSWATQTSAFGAYGRALPVLGANLGLGVGLSLLGAAAMGGGGDLFLDGVLSAARGDGGAALGQGLTVALAVLVVYTAMQLPKRHRASRGSWLPALLLLPAILLRVALGLGDAVGQGLGAVLMVLIDLAWVMGAGALVGGSIATLWITGAAMALEEGRAPAGAVLARGRARLADGVVAFGTRHQIVQVGLQVVVPGIWYAIGYAFADAVAILRGDRPMLAGSVELTRGIRGKLFKVLTAYALAAFSAQGAVVLAFLPPEEAFAAMFDPTLLPTHVAALAELPSWLAAWWCAVAMVVLFLERDALLQAKLARDAARAEAEADPA